MITATLRTWGGSVALPIPKKLLSLASLDVGHEVTLNVEGGRLVVEAVRPKYSLAQLMKEHKAVKLPHDDAWLSFDDLPSERV